MAAATRGAIGRAAGLWLVLFPAFMLTGCHRQPAESMHGRDRAAPQVLAFAATTSQRGAPPEAAESTLVPTATYPSLAAACDRVQQAMSDRLHVSVSRADSVPFENEFVRARRIGCELKASGTFARETTDTSSNGRDADGDLTDALAAAGWVDIPRYTADGPDGSIAGMRSRETACIFAWSWDGGDDSDSTYVPSNQWDLVTHCAGIEPGDSI